MRLRTQPVTLAEHWAPCAAEWGADYAHVGSLAAAWFYDTDVAVVRVGAAYIAPRWAWAVANAVELGYERAALRALLAQVAPRAAAAMFALGGAKALLPFVADMVRPW